MPKKIDPRKKKEIKGDKGFEDPFFIKKDEDFEDPFFLKIQPIIQKMQSDASFFTQITTDFSSAVAPYRLTKEEMAALKDKMRSVKRPKGLNDVAAGHNPMDL